jgi:hypothetical protein
LKFFRKEKLLRFYNYNCFANYFSIVSDSIICELLSQGDEKTTKIYLDEFDEDTLKESSEKALMAVI